MDDIPRSLILILCLIPFAGFFAGSETAFSFCNEARIRALAENGKAGAKRLAKLLDDFDRTIVTLLIVINICYILISAVATVAAVKLLSSDLGGALATVAATLLVFLFCETIPKNIARVNADTWALIAAYPVSLFKFLLAPLSAFFTYVGEAFKKLLPGGASLPDVTEDEFEEMVESVEDEGLIEPVEKEIIKSTIHFGDILAGQVMTPIDGVVTVPVDIDREALKSVLLEEKYSRIPVTGEDIDDIVGVLPAAKALSRLSSDTFGDIRDIMTRPYIIRPDIPVSKVFEGMSGRRTHLAVVQDDGHTLGIVTMEDILEEIAGEIYDEDDEKGAAENAR